MRELSAKLTEGEKKDYPSVKNQRFLPAPLTRGAKGGFAAKMFDKSHFGISLAVRKTFGCT